MLYVKIMPPTLENDEVHTKTWVQISENEDFSDMLIDDEKEVELLARDYNISLATGTKYYARVRFYLEPGGYQAWSDTIIFEVEDSNDMELFIIPPIYADIPEIVSSIDSGDFYPIKYLRFNLGISKDSEDKIRKVDWFLFDMDNNLVYDLSNESSTLDYIYIHKELEMNQVYVLKASITTITNTTSDFASFVFRTHISNVLIIDESIEYSLGSPLSFDINPVDSFDIEIYDMNSNKVYEGTDSGDHINIPDYGVTLSTILFVRVRETGSDIWNYVYRYSVRNTNRLPFKLPTQL